MNITNPATVMRAFISAATIAAARMVVQAAKVRSQNRAARRTRALLRSPASSRKLSSFSVDALERHRVQLAVRRFFLIEVLLQDGSAVAAAEHVCPCDQRAVAGDFIVLDGLGGGDKAASRTLLSSTSPATSLASSRMPSMAGQSTPLASTPCIWKTSQGGRSGP